MAVEIILWAAALGVGVCVAVVTCETLMALLPARPMKVNRADHASVAVLVPAHNEAAVIGQTVRALKDQLRLHDRLLVIADNCDDATAAQAREAGAEVAERIEPELRGKGYALAFGVAKLVDHPPDVVVMFDADTEPGAHAIEKLRETAATTDRPVQGVYLLTAPNQPTPRSSISQWAFVMKNQVRPTGLARLGWPVPLTGTGMAFPWHALMQVPLASGNIVEDMQLGVDLAVHGYAPLLCHEATITGTLPDQADAEQSQRTRWEHGHLHTLLTQVPRLIKESVKQRRVDLLAMAFDLAVPPLSLLFAFWAMVALLTGGAALSGLTVWPFVTLLVSGLLLALAVVLSWTKFARSQVPARALLSVPFYVFWKMPIYLSFLGRRQQQWVRTSRDSDHQPRPASSHKV